MLTQSSALAKDKRTGLAPMQHRHFSTIAAIIQSWGEPDGITYALASHFADELDATNPNFDRARFLRACGVTS